MQFSFFDKTREFDWATEKILNVKKLLSDFWIKFHHDALKVMTLYTDEENAGLL